MEKLSNFVDLARSEEEAKKDAYPVQASELPKYPYGTMVTFDDNSLKKLQISLSDFEVGDEIEFEVRGKVSSINQYEKESGQCGSVSIQITAIAVEDENDSYNRTPDFVKNPYSKK